ncbi:unnamed protein product [Macrosiphum euphorbiae]|uniref:DUF4371 domain-containing protein n=1 Tax=Macrosiphum euphorbiae TaxID=13131 RepID=A0AAV0WP94_9HEMI|nr:unnamed protein product [Macrosiphum euphorbiae]
MTLGFQNLSFRGHNEKIDSENRGNFLAVIDLLVIYVPILSELLQRGPKKINYLSATIQNEIIDMIAKCVKKSIISDVQKVPFFSYITDTTQDIRKHYQMSQIIRYVVIEKNEDNKPIKLRIEESFLGFCLLNDHSASGFADQIVENIKNDGLDISNLRGQSYDGAAVMAGIYNGVQTKIKAHSSLAEYIHCNAYNLNLVLNDTMTASIEIEIFFSIIQKLYVYFTLSGKRWKILTDILPVGGVTLKKVCSTRWSSCHQAISPIRFNFLNVLKALTKIILLSKNKNEISEAKQLVKSLESFSFVLTLVFVSDILRKVDGVSQLLQQRDIDLHKATGLLQTLTSSLKIIRGNFSEFFTEATNLSKTWGITPTFKNQRYTKKKMFFDELCEDQRLKSPGKNLK